MKVSGKKTRRTAVEFSIMLTEIFMTAIGSSIRQMDSELTTTQTEANMRASGSMIFSMAKGKRLGRTGRHTKGHTNPDRSMGKDSISGQMAVFIQASGPTIRFKASASTSGLMVASTLASG